MRKLGWRIFITPYVSCALLDCTNVENVYQNPGNQLAIVPHQQPHKTRSFAIPFRLRRCHKIRCYLSTNRSSSVPHRTPWNAFSPVAKVVKLFMPQHTLDSLKMGWNRTCVDSNKQQVRSFKWHLTQTFSLGGARLQRTPLDVNRC